jgi:hypothetical protein
VSFFVSTAAAYGFIYQFCFACLTVKEIKVALFSSLKQKCTYLPALLKAAAGSQAQI